MTYKRLIKRIEFFVRLWTSGQVPGTLNQSYKRQWDIAVWQLPGVNAHWQDCRATATTVVQSSNPLYDVSRVIRVVQTLGTLVIHFLNLGSSGWFIRGYLGYTPRHTDSFHRSSRLFRRRHYWPSDVGYFASRHPVEKPRGVDEPSRGSSPLWKFIHRRRKLLLRVESLDKNFLLIILR